MENERRGRNKEIREMKGGHTRGGTRASGLNGDDKARMTVL